MSWIDGTRARLRLLFGRTAADSRFTHEIQFHIDMEAERLRRDEGLDAGEARRRAIIAFGGVENYKEELRGGRGLRWLSGLSLDLKLGLRMLAKWPGLTLVGVVGMAVAVAIGTVSFGMVQALVGQTIPLEDGDRLVMVENWDARSSRDNRTTPLHDLAEWRTSAPAVSEFGAYRLINRNFIVAEARPQPVQVAEMTASGFRIARVAPLMGRHLLDEDERIGAPNVVVIGHEVWQTRFAGADNIIGRTIQLGDTRHEIVGIMPPEFAFPVNNRIWTPLRLDPLQYASGEAPGISVFGRLADGSSVKDAATQLSRVAERLAPTRPEQLQHIRTRVLPYGRAFAENPGMAWVMHLAQFAISLLLVVIGVNVATLVYARTAGRMGELAVRTALGASRGRIVAQLFAEALVLSCIATVLGLAGALFVLRYLQENAMRLAGDQLPYWMHFGISGGMVVYVFGLALLAAFVIGALPALKATSRSVRANLQQLGGGGGSMRLGRSWTILIVAQVAIAVALLPVVFHVTVVRRSERAAGPTYATHEWVTASLHLDRATSAGASPTTDSAFATTYSNTTEQFVRRLREESSVADVVLMSGVPGIEPDVSIEVDTVGSSAQGAVDNGNANSNVFSVRTTRVDAGFFDAFDIPVLAGRALQRGDGATASNAIVVNQPFVQTVFGGGNALGRRVRFHTPPAELEADGRANTQPPAPWYEIVGVVPDFPGTATNTTRHAVMYHALRPGRTDAAVLAARVRGATPLSLTGRLREVAVAVDPMLRLEDVRALDDTQDLEGVLDGVIFAAILLVVLSVVLLSAAGVYALMSFTIARQRREIGIRAALGAGARQVVGGVFARAARQVGTGVAFGVVLAFLMIQQIDGWAWELRSMLGLMAVATFMGLIGVLSSLGPAREALRIQPTEALRAD